ncbi:MAG: phosphoglucosamine mutase [Zetaproteobacteria bacterium]|nr:phosphoglucosamine mutase [Pseudobdellovibrionaceae bacterium]
MNRLFGTDGIRGRANFYPMSIDMVLRIGQAIGIYFKKKCLSPKIIIGKDTRRSGYILEQALSSGIGSVGVETFFLGPLPTPGIAYLTRGMRASAGIVISASHNPYFDNGIKIFSADGYKLPNEAEDEVEAILRSKKINNYLVAGREIGVSLRIDDAIGQYAVFLKEQFPKKLSLEGVRIVIDCANGASYKVAPKVFEELGAEVFTINNKPNGLNINDQCGALYPLELVEKVKLYKADIGFAFDGDADRLICVDEKGVVLDGDEILAVCGVYYLENNRLRKNTLVATIMSNMGLDIALQKHKGKLIRTDVGDRHVVEAMRKGGFSLGGEQSGHLVFRDCSTTGDGILAALFLLETIIEKETPLSELRKVLTKFPQNLSNIEVPAKIPLKFMPELDKKIKSINSDLGQKGRLLFRYSGTEMKARIMVESYDAEKVGEYVDDLSSFAVSTIGKYYKKGDYPTGEKIL